MLGGGLVANFLPSAAALLFVLFLSYKYIKSRYELVYFVVFISLIGGLAGLYGNRFNGLLSLGPIDISLLTLFIFVNYVKFLYQYNTGKNKFHFRKPVIIYLIYFAFLVVTGFYFGVETAGKSGLRHYYQIANIMILMPVFLILPYMLQSSNFIARLSNLLFVSVFINILGQLIFLLKGVPISQIINPDPAYYLTSGETDYLQDSLRPVLAPWLVLMTLFLSYFSIVKNDRIFRNNYLYIVLFASFVSIFITATRGWILAFILFITVGTMLFMQRIGKRVAGLLIYGVFLFLLIYLTSGVFRVQMNKSFDRFATIGLILEGDLSAGGTSIRHIRGAKVMKGFYESPAIGLGFSSKSLNLTDVHVGNQMILLSGGIIGLFVILVLLLGIVYKTHGFHLMFKKYRRNLGGYHGELQLVPVFFLSLFMIHSTSTALFGFSVYAKAYGNMFWVVIVISLVNKIINEYLDELKNINHND